MCRNRKYFVPPKICLLAISMTLLLVISEHLVIAVKHGTSIVALPSGDKVFIGSDTKTAVFRPAERGDKQSSKILKIGHNTLLAVAGLFATANGDLDVYKKATECFEKTSSINSAVAILAEELKPQISTVMWRLAKSNPSLCQQCLRNPGPGFVSVLYVALESDCLIYHAVTFRPRVNQGQFGNGFIVDAEQHSGSAVNPDFLCRLGDHDYSDAVLKQNPRYPHEQDAKTVINDFITGEVRLHPEDVGLPVEIFSLSKEGIQKVQ